MSPRTQDPKTLCPTCSEPTCEHSISSLQQHLQSCTPNPVECCVCSFRVERWPVCRHTCDPKHAAGRSGAQADVGLTVAIRLVFLAAGASVSPSVKWERQPRVASVRYCVFAQGLSPVCAHKRGLHCRVWVPGLLAHPALLGASFHGPTPSFRPIWDISGPSGGLPLSLYLRPGWNSRNLRGC